MKKILILGVGKSSTYLFEYLSEKSSEYNWTILACDKDENAILERTAHLKNVVPVTLDIQNLESLKQCIQESDIVVSMLPAAMHPQIASICLECCKHMATASYVSPEMRAMDKEAQEKGLVFLNEMGLDPGLDHMSAMEIIDNLKSQGKEVVSFESYCGGLVHPADCIGNPWQYKFSWNPRNVILAGQGGMSIYKKDNVLRYIPWHRVFEDAQKLELGNYGVFDAYPNRDSLGYIQTYGLENTQTFLRGTLRRENFCKAWQVLVKLGFTDDNTILAPSINSPYLLTQALTGFQGVDFSEWLLSQGHITAALLPYFQFLNLENNVDVPSLNAPTAAGKLQQWLTNKWELYPQDRDEVVMHHRIGYLSQTELHWVTSTLQLFGSDAIHTAMAKSVGLPLAIGVELILTNKVNLSGVQIPISKLWYQPVLKLLKEHGIFFHESHN